MPRPKEALALLGCRGNNRYWDPIRNVVSCPNAHKPRVRERVDRARKEWKVKRYAPKKRNSNTKVGDGGVGGDKSVHTNATFATGVVFATASIVKEVFQSAASYLLGHTGQVIQFKRGSK